jgi:oxaloacetate decarboxylase beta subunit
MLMGAAARSNLIALIGAVAEFHSRINFDLHAAASIGIIGGADGPTAIYVTSRLASELLGRSQFAAYRKWRWCRSSAADHAAFATKVER